MNDISPKNVVLGLVAFGVVVLLALGTVASFTQLLTPSVDATVRTERAGLLMADGADVSLYGLSVGEVRSIVAKDGGAVLDVAFDPSLVDRIPADVTASITAPTVFGAKFVQLEVPPAPTGGPIREGAVIQASNQSLEAQSVLEQLNILLRTVDVAALNSGLGAVSTSLQGRGGQLGELIVQLETFLEKFNPNLPALSDDLGKAGTVADNYAAVTPDLIRILDNLTVTSRTLVDKQPAIAGLLTDLIKVSNNGKKLLDDNGDAIITTLDVLRPTSGVLGRYAPMYPCLFASLNTLRRDIEPVIGSEYPGIHTFTSFLPGSDGYKYPDELPKVENGADPSCYGGPFNLRAGDAPIPHVRFDDGTKFYDRRNDDVELGLDPFSVLLFGEAGRNIPAGIRPLVPTNAPPGPNLIPGAAPASGQTPASPGPAPTPAPTEPERGGLGSLFGGAE